MIQFSLKGENFLHLTLTILASLIFINFQLLADDNAQNCDKFFANKSYTKALDFCLKSSKGKEFELGLIYHKLRNCSSRNEWFIEHNTPKSYTNIGIGYMYGEGGCRVNKVKAKEFFTKANDLVKHCPKMDYDTFKCKVEEQPSKIGYFASNYYLAQLEQQNQNSDYIGPITFPYLLKSIIGAPSYTDAWGMKIRQNTKDYLSRYMNKYYSSNDSGFLIDILKQPDALFLNSNPDSNWLHQNFDKILETGGYYTTLIEKPLLDKKLYTLHARMNELGIGKIQDVGYAFRIYLVEAKNGNSFAAKWRDDLKKNLSQKVIKESTCLAKKTNRNKQGFYEKLTWFDKLTCKF